MYIFYACLLILEPGNATLDLVCVKQVQVILADLSSNCTKYELVCIVISCVDVICFSTRSCVVAKDQLFLIGGQEGDFMAKPGSPIFKCSRRQEV